jgi:hypothetical protein
MFRLVLEFVRQCSDAIQRKGASGGVTGWRFVLGAIQEHLYAQELA